MSSDRRSANHINVRVMASYENPVPVREGGVVVALVGLPIDAWSEDPRLPFDVALKIEADGAGVPVCSSLQCKQRDGQTPVTKTDLTKLPLRALVDEAVRKASMPVSSGGEGRVEIDLFDEPPASVKDVYAVFRRPRPHTSHRVTDEHLQNVARIYEQAIREGDPPTKTVMDVLHLTRPTAGRHVGLARDKGYLPKTSPGKKKGNEQ